MTIALSGAANGAQPRQTPPRFPAAQTGDAKPLDRSWARLPGYLSKSALPDGFAILPPPPEPSSGSAGEMVDRSAYLATRRLVGTPRWALARADAQESAAAAAADFDCVLGLDITAERAPALLHLLTRLRTDAGVVSSYAKNHFRHPRPFVSYGGPICTEEDRADLIRSWSYPSGHTTMMWSIGLVMAELAPDRATDILARARAYGESRVVCGVHTVSDVEEGRTTASIVVALVHTDPQFQTDLAAARRELLALRAAPGAGVPAGRMCAAEGAAMARTPWLPAKAAEPLKP